MTSHTLDLSQNEFEGKLALALEGNGLTQGLCKMAARVALLMALDGRDPTDQALTWTNSDVQMLVGLCQGTPPRRIRVTSVSAENWQRLNDLASNTYVPESDASKLSGAGAGLTDND